MYPDGIRHIRADKRVNEWKTPGKKTIVKCAVNQRQVVIALTGGELVYFEMDPVCLLCWPCVIFHYGSCGGGSDVVHWWCYLHMCLMNTCIHSQERELRMKVSTSKTVWPFFKEQKLANLIQITVMKSLLKVK